MQLGWIYSAMESKIELHFASEESIGNRKYRTGGSQQENIFIGYDSSICVNFPQLELHSTLFKVGLWG